MTVIFPKKPPTLKHMSQKTYLVKAKGRPRLQDLKKLTTGVTTPFGKKKALFAQLVFGARGAKKAERSFYVKIIIAEGKKRQLRWMLQALGYPVLKLRRTAVGRLNLGALKKGAYKPLREEDVKKVFLKPKELVRKKSRR